MTIAQTRKQSQAANRFSENASCNEALGNTANISAKASKSVKKQRLLRHAQSSLSEANMVSERTGKPHRTRFCQAARAHGADAITIKLNRDDMRSDASFGGLQNCGCVWACPVCAPRIAVEKGEFILKALDWAKQTGHFPVMVALTARHNFGMTLEGFKSGFKEAWSKFSKHRSWQNFKLRFGITHWIANREVTHGGNGWHYHMHLLLFIDLKAAAAADAADIQSEMEALWISSLNAANLEGLPGIALKVSAHSNVGERYLVKIGLTTSEETGKLEYEMTGSFNKDSRTIWDILRHSYYGDEISGLLYLEYVAAMTGDNFITTSHGLVDLVNSVSEADTESSERQDEQRQKMYDWAEISPYWWEIVLKAGGRADILEVSARTRDVDAVRKVLWRLQDELIDAGQLRSYHRSYRHMAATSEDFSEGLRLMTEKPLSHQRE